MDGIQKERVVEALEMAKESLQCLYEDFKRGTLAGNPMHNLQAITGMASSILIANSLGEFASAIARGRAIARYLGVDMGKGDDQSVLSIPPEYRDRIDQQPESWLPEPDGIGYWYVKFPDGATKMARVEVANSNIDDVKFVAFISERDVYYISQTSDVYNHYRGCKWLKVSPQL